MAAPQIPGADVLAPPDRAAVVAMIAGYRERDPADVGEKLDSLELTWLVAQVEQRYGVELDLTDEVFEAMATVTGAVEALRSAIPAAAGG